MGGVAAALLRTRTGTTSRVEGMPVAEALKTAPFWLLFASLVLSCIGLFVPMVHLSPYATDAGYSQAQGVALVSLIGVGSLAGRFTVGAPADRIGRLPSLCAMYAGLGVMFLLWYVASAYWMLVVFAIVFGVCYGSCVALLPTIVMDLYGPRAVSGIIGCLYTGAGIGTLLGPWLAGVAYDTVGSYQLAILAGAVFSAGAAACVVILLYGGQAKAFDRG